MPVTSSARGDEVDEAVAEQVGDRLDVGGLAGDHPARRVALVERRAEALEVEEEALADVEHDVLARPARGCSRNALNEAAATTVAASTPSTVVTSGRMVPLPPSSSGGMPSSMPRWIEPRHGQLARRAERDQERGLDDGAAVRAHEVAEQRPAAAAQEAGEAAGDLLLVLDVDAAPLVDQLVAGEVERAPRGRPRGPRPVRSWSWLLTSSRSSIVSASSLRTAR